MKNAICATIAASCFLLAGHAPAKDRTFLVASYSHENAVAVVEDSGSLPKHSFVAQGGTLIWAIFDTEDRNAETYLEHSLDAYVIAEKKLPELRDVCVATTEPESVEQKRCLADFHKLMEVVYE